MLVKPIIWGSKEGDIARDIRTRVFIDEQKVPLEIELDEIDPVAYHVLAFNKNGKPVATGRFFEEPDDAGAGHIGRMAVLADKRGNGYGRAVLMALMREGISRGCNRLVLDSQVHAIPFYEKIGFEICGPEHMDAGIPHKMMQMSSETAESILKKLGNT